ncbi:MAG: DUF5060 domain-containing protein [Candidatus Hydrogenedentes bacterium]|nr:DUF5060 domain-containing protein [Candidatus Hydrogenedentota bacterium]
MMIGWRALVRLFALFLVVAEWTAGAEDFAVSGSLRKWEPVRIDFDGPEATVTDNEPNPFLDYRLQVEFTSPSGNRVSVPGFFDGDGAGGVSGSVWRVYFSPDETGKWAFKAQFRKGPEIAVSLEAEAGEATAFDGAAGAFDVAAQDPEAPGFYRWGRLEYAGGHYLKFRDGGYWLKGGTDSPEDFLAYAGFSNTPRAKYRFESHVPDWREGDPDWGDGKGKAIIGALNYLASVKVNSIYFLPMNIGGDGKNVWPYVGPIDGKGGEGNDNLHFDVAKLREWGIVFEHAQRQGILLHFVLNEAEENNKRELDDAAFGVERKLYYRELVARFAHLPALQWNLCEEYNLNIELAPDMVKECAQYFRDVDPYDHPVTVHHAGKVEEAWAPFLADPRFQVTSFQTNETDIVEVWRKQSREAGFPQVIGMDEFFPDYANAENAGRHRREYIWPVYLSGGQLEFIYNEKDDSEDFRNYEPHWRYMAYARTFMEEHLPFWEMEPNDALLTGASEFQGEHNLVKAQVFAKEGECYAIYLPVATETGTFDLSGAQGEFVQRWYNPRAGEFAGTETRVSGGGPVELGAPPSDPAEDWVVVLVRP